MISLVLVLFPLQGKFILTLDRTGRKWGKKPISILMLPCAYLGVGIPLFWMVLDRAGNSLKKDRAYGVVGIKLIKVKFFINAQIGILGLDKIWETQVLFKHNNQKHRKIKLLASKSLWRIN